MRNRLFSLVLLCFAASLAAAQDAEYSRLLDKVKGGDTAIDYKALRLAAAGSSQFAAMTVDSKLRLRLIDAVKAKKFDEITKLSQEIMKVNFLDMNAHVYAATAYQAIKDKKKADFHQAVYVGLINSIVNSADGESMKTAYQVISLDEITSVLNAYELQKTQQETVSQDGRTYMLVTATDKATGGTSKVYFNVDLVAKTLEKITK